MVALPGIAAPYKNDLVDYQPVVLAAQSPVAMLILQGERDFQVRMTDFNLWKAGLAQRKNVTLRSYPALSHLFIAGEGKSTPAEYDKPAHVDPQVLDDIAAWINGR